MRGHAGLPSIMPFMRARALAGGRVHGRERESLTSMRRSHAPPRHASGSSACPLLHIVPSPSSPHPLFAPLYRWISQKYPKIVKDCIEEIPEWVNGTEIPVNTSEPNPNGIEFDNLYLVKI